MVAATEPITIQSAVQKAGMLTDEAIRNGALKKVTKKRGNSGELSRDGKARDDNKKPKTRRVFSTITNPVRKEYTGTAPKCANYSFHHNPEIPYRKCTNCNRLGHFAKDCRTGPRMVMAIEGGLGHGNNGNQVHEGAFMIGAEEARQDPNIVTGTFTLNNQYAMRLFDSGVDYSFVSTTFIPLLGIEPCDLEGHTFDIDLIPFGHRTFDVSRNGLVDPEQ
ncbi:putative reverse transcriptase domain-containing protein, partial [Tanacetum coccineum]